MNKQSPPKKLTRSPDDRYIGGVAAGIAKRLNLDPVFVRIAFLASLVFGGLGLLVYVALLAVMPIEGDPAQPLPPVEPKRRNMMIGLAVVVGVLALFTADSGGFAAWIFGFWPGTVFGVLFWVAAGAGTVWLLATGTFSRPPEPGVPGAGSPGFSGPPASGQATAASSPAPEGSSPGPDEASTEVVTYAESPTQLSRTEVMETREVHGAGAFGSAEAPESTPSGQGSGPGHDDGPSTIGKIMVWFAIGLTALTVFCLLFVFSAGTTVLFGGVPMAALVIVLGAGMVFAGLRGRRQVSLWLLTAAVAITIPMAAVSIADLRVEGNYGDINETPLSVIDIPDDGYKMAAGNMTIDLRKFRFDRQRELDLPVKSGMGLTSIIVPDEICVAGSIAGKAGVANIRGRQSNGISIRQTAPGPVNWKPGMEARGQVLYVLADFKLGAFEIVDDTQWRQDGQAGSFGENDLEPDDRASEKARERANAACADSGSPASEDSGSPASQRADRKAGKDSRGKAGN